jgi:hypothetical protein
MAKSFIFALLNQGGDVADRAKWLPLSNARHQN